MKKIFLSALFTLSIYTVTVAQGIVRGKITDASGETQIGVTIVVKSNPSIGTVTDLDGNYSLTLKDSTTQTLVVSSIGYELIEEVVRAKKGEVIIKNFILKSTAHEMKEIEVTAKGNHAKDSYIESMKKSSSVTLDYISSETIKKTGDANVTAAVARVSGVSTNGSFITVRGIGDRYVKTAINGLRIPTLDPFTNNIKLDLFPASLVDNVIITKTESPDLPGDFAGAYISVETKDYPEQLAINFETSVGYNNQTTFKDIVSSQQSSTNWLGFDNNFRDHNHDLFIQNIKQPTDYQQFVALGLGAYYTSLGITNENWSANSDVYYKLGLIQLGLLSPAQIDDAAAYQAAKIQYISGPYSQQAFETINANVPESGKSFPNNWNTISRKAPLDFSQSFSIGTQTKLFGRPFGFLFGYRYGSSTKYDPEYFASKIKSDGTRESLFNGAHSEEVNGWSAIENIAYKFSPNHSVSFLFMPNFSGANKADNLLDNLDSTILIYKKIQFYEQRKQLVYQLKSEHFFPGKKIRAEFSASYTDGNSSVPDFKTLRYIYRKDIDTWQIGGDNGDIDRYYRYLSDNLFDSKASIKIPFYDKPGLPRKLKLGGAYQYNFKENQQYDYNVQFGSNSNLALKDGNIDAFFDLNNFGFTNGTVSGIPYSTIKEYYVEDGTPANHTFGKSEITAGFLMIDYTIVPRLRFSGGVRIEHADLFTDVFKFDSIGYEKNDPRRNYSSSFPLVNPGKLNETNYLPSANLILKLNGDSSANNNSPINLRLNYSSSIARPSLRELSDVAQLDYEFKEFVFGNSDLKTVHINNYDLRLESYFKSGDNISISLLYKNFKNHIELVRSVGLTWQNVDHSYVAGIELEGKKILGKHFEFRGNCAFLKSQTKFVRNRVDISDGVKQYIPIDTLTRTMFGQAPYVLNGMLTYNADSIGLSFTVSYNVQGERLVITSANPFIPDVYELPRNVIDAKVIKKFGKHFSTSVTVRDILNTSVTRIYKGTDFIYDEYSYGTNFLIGISYKL